MEPNMPAAADGSVSDSTNDTDAVVTVLRETVVLLRQALTRLLGEDAGDDYGLSAEGSAASEATPSIAERNLTLHRIGGRMIDRLRSH